MNTPRPENHNLGLPPRHEKFRKLDIPLKRSRSKSPIQKSHSSEKERIRTPQIERELDYKPTTNEQNQESFPNFHKREFGKDDDDNKSISQDEQFVNSLFVNDTEEDAGLNTEISGEEENETYDGDEFIIRNEDVYYIPEIDDTLIQDKVPFVSKSSSDTSMLYAKIQYAKPKKYKISIPVVLKVSYLPKHLVYNSYQVESKLYTTDIRFLIKNNHSPFLLESFGSYDCDSCTTFLPKNVDSSNLSKTNEESTKQHFDISSQHVLILEKVSSTPLSSVIRTLSEYDLNTVVFQVLWTLRCFNSLRIKHNDLHLGNIFVEKMEKPFVFQFKYSFKHNSDETILFSMKTNYVVRIFDFDRASVYGNFDVPRNIFLDNEMCNKVGTCNVDNPYMDVFGFLIYLYKYVSVESLFYNFFLTKILNIHSEYFSEQNKLTYFNLMSWKKKNGSYWTIKEFTDSLTISPNQTIEYFMSYIDTISKNPVGMRNNPFLGDIDIENHIVLTIPPKRVIKEWFPKIRYVSVNFIKDDSKMPLFDKVEDFIKEQFVHEINLMYDNWNDLMHKIQTVYRDFISPEKYDFIKKSIAMASGILCCSIFYQMVMRPTKLAQYKNWNNSELILYQAINILLKSELSPWINHVKSCIQVMSNHFDQIPVSIPYI